MRDSRFILLSISVFFASFAVLVPVYFIPDFAIERLEVDLSTGAAMISAYNGASAVGRIILGFGADGFIGRINCLVLCMVVSAVSVMIWAFSTTSFFLFLFAIVNGVGVCFWRYISIICFSSDTQFIVIVCGRRIYFIITGCASCDFQR